MVPESVFQWLLKGHCGKIIEVTVSLDKALRLFLMQHFVCVFTYKNNKVWSSMSICRQNAGVFDLDL